MNIIIALVGIVLAFVVLTGAARSKRGWVAALGMTVGVGVGVPSLMFLAYSIDTHGTDQSYRPQSGVVEELHTRIVKQGYGSREEVIIEHSEGYLICEDAYCFTLDVGDSYTLECRDDYDEDALMCREG